jgi:hypothetical protein
MKNIHIIDGADSYPMGRFISIQTTGWGPVAPRPIMRAFGAGLLEPALRRPTRL